MRCFKLLILALALSLTACDSDHSSLSYSGAWYPGNDLPLPGDRYNLTQENDFVSTLAEATSTFSIDADGASYANMRRFIAQENQLPPKTAVRTEEFINYFDLDYPFSSENHPVDINAEISTCPWDSAHKLVRLGIQGKSIPDDAMPASNYVFLIDVSGSMNGSDKLPLLQRGFKLLADQLQAQDRVAIVTYAGSSEVLLPSTSGDKKAAIKQAIHDLSSGGGTAGAQGIRTAYNIAQQNLIPGGNNRVILGTDGDFNIGISNQDSLVSLIERKRESGIFLTVLGVGRGNLNDGMMEQLANNGNGNYEYLDKPAQLNKVFIHEASKFHTVAKDVKVQVEFDPKIVKRYRLIGYENRLLSNNDFNNDSADAGEIGADQNITALYEIETTESADFLKKSPAFTFKLRYKDPNGNQSKLLSLSKKDLSTSFENSSDAMKFTACVAAFSMQLLQSPYKGNYNYQKILETLGQTQLDDPYGYKAEFEALVRRAKSF